MRRYLFLASQMTADTVILVMAPFIALYLRFEGVTDGVYFQQLVLYLPVIVGVQLLIFNAFRLYRRLWEYAGIYELVAIVGASVSGTIVLLILAIAGGVNMPRSLYLLNAVLTIVMVGAVRLAIRQAYHHRNELLTAFRGERVLIVGAGSAGIAIVKEIRGHSDTNRKIVGFIDDNPAKRGKILNGVKVLGGKGDIKSIVVERQVQEIIVAVPSASSKQVREIIQLCRETKCRVKIVPSLREVLDGMVTMRQLRDIKIEDLLGREPVRLDTTLMSACLAHRRVLVTGAGGSIGSELCRKIAALFPAKLYLLGKSENNIFEIERELRAQHGHLEIVPIIADICDEKRIRKLFGELQPEIVFHAAAHKHVPLMEAQPAEAVRNNIFGTRNVAEAAVAAGVDRFVMISSDKAVNPTSIMGVTKRVAEMICCGMNGKGETKFAAVRFGNVLGSRGSVVPLFRRLIARGKTIPITHPEMRRFFMTIPEAAQLVLQAGAMAQGGEVFVLDMGEPVKILDLACRLIELTGLTPYKDIPIEFTGLRPGEKLFEELLTAEEGSLATKHEKIYVANLKRVDEKKLHEALAFLKNADDTDKIVASLSKMVPTYQSPRIERLRVVDGTDHKAL
ncbi:MAG: nucleoside-diphosphate sugar epimerase/dehydratase [Negativicutes bacterium]|nr:nucleoside-diphosphate sugar epimerase/dehydratase [Negativicutes bacterium]